MFNFVLRRESVAFSMSEVPLAIAVVFVTPGPALLARIIGGLVVIVALRPQPAYKLVFNLALFTMEMVCTYLFVRLLVNSWGDGDTALVVAVVAATFVTGVVGTTLVSLAISRFEGDFTSRVVTELRLAWWLLFVNATLAGMVLSLGLISLGLILLAVVPIGLLWYVMKAYGVIEQRLRDLDAVHGFTGRVGQSLDPGEIGRAAVEEAADILRTEGVTLVLFDHLGRTLIESHGNVGVWLPTQPDDPTWHSLIGADKVSIISGERARAVPFDRLEHPRDHGGADRRPIGCHRAAWSSPVAPVPASDSAATTSSVCRTSPSSSQPASARACSTSGSSARPVTTA